MHAAGMREKFPHIRKDTPQKGKRASEIGERTEPPLRGHIPEDRVPSIVEYLHNNGLLPLTSVMLVVYQGTKLKCVSCCFKSESYATWEFRPSV